MARQVDFGNDGDKPLAGILHDFARLLLRVEALMGLAVILARVVSYDRLGAVCAHGGEFRVFLDFDAPALVVGQVPVEAVDVVQREHVDEALHGVEGHEMARHVEVRTAIGEARRICHLAGRYFYALSSRLQHGQSLAQCLHAVEQPGVACALDADAVLGDIDGVALAGGIFLTGGGEGDAVLCGLCGHGEAQMQSAFDVASQCLCGALLRFIAFLIDDARFFVDDKRCARGGFHRARRGHHVEVGSLCRQRGRHAGKSRQTKDGQDTFCFHSIIYIIMCVP